MDNSAGLIGGNQVKLAHLLLLFIFCLLSTNLVLAAEKHALIIANKDYLYGGSLVNPIKDSRELSRTLSAAGFSVKVMENLTLDGMRQAISDFGWQHSETDNVAMVYYSGHGAEFDGENYLIPVDAKLDDVRRARSEALTLNDVQNFMYREISDEDRAKGINAVGLNIIVLDACRNNPYPARKKSAARGLGEVEGASGTLIWYAAQPGAQADDGEGSDLSPFANAFTKAVDASSGESVEETFKQVAKLTLKATEGLQEPWQAGNILGRFSFKKGNSSWTNSRLLADFDPSALDANNYLFKFDNPQKISVKNFGVWNLGGYRFAVPPHGETLTFEPGYYWKYRENRDHGTYHNVIWQEFQPGAFANFQWGLPKYDEEDSQRFLLFSLDFLKPITSKNCFESSCGIYYDLTLEDQNREILDWRNDSIEQKLYVECYSSSCNSYSPIRFPVSLFSELYKGNYLVLNLMDKYKSIVKSKFRQIRVPLTGLGDAIAHFLEQEEFEGRILEAVRLSGLENYIERPLENAGFLDQFYDGNTNRQDTIDKFGVAEADKFQALFENALEIDASGYAGLCRNDPHVNLTRIASRYLYKIGVSDATSEARRVAQQLLDKTISSLEAKLRVGDTTCGYFLWTKGYTAEAIQGDATNLFNAMIAGAQSPHSDYSTIWNIINNHMHYFPDGGGALGYRDLKSLSDSVFYWGEWRDYMPDKIDTYLSLVKAHEIEEMHRGAWDKCLNSAEASSVEGRACFREFVLLFPNSEHLEDATVRIAELDSQSKCQVSAAVWSFLSDSKNTEKLEEFAVKHAGCPQSALALERIKALEGG